MQNIENFQSSFPVIPDLLELEELKVKGAVRFEGTSSLKGKVYLTGLNKPLTLPSGVVIADESRHV